MTKISTARKISAAVLMLALAGCGSQRLPAPVEELAEPVQKRTVEEKPEPVVSVPDYHLVARDETLFSIALNYGLKHGQLALWNNLRNPDLITVGQRLRLKPPGNSPSVRAVESVRSSGLVKVESAQTPTPEPVTPAATGTTGGGGTAKAVTNAATGTGSNAATGTGGNAATNAAGTAGTAAGSAAATAASAVANVVVRSTVVNAPNTAPVTSDVPETAQLKTTPLAAKYIYSPQLLKKLQQQWAQRTAVAAPIPKPGATPDKPTASAGAATAADVAAPARSRQRFEVTWSWPTAGKVRTPFSEPGKGMDFAGARGAPIFASAAGEVIYVGTGVKSYGRMIIIKHPNDYLTAYAHVDEVFVKEGERVARGGKIAGFGDSGAEQVKLHFEVRKVGKPIDPLQVLPETPN